jgi:hypothetical protein
LTIPYLAQAQKQRFAREDEIRATDFDSSSKESGLNTFILLFLADSDKY